jgi:hypothetical protein
MKLAYCDTLQLNGEELLYYVDDDTNNDYLRSNDGTWIKYSDNFDSTISVDSVTDDVAKELEASHQQRIGADQTQWLHPETLPGEVYCGNTYPENFHKSSFKTKRLGLIAYSVDGKLIQSMRPWFASKSEFEQAQADLTAHKQTHGK